MLYLGIRPLGPERKTQPPGTPQEQRKVQLKNILNRGEDDITLRDKTIIISQFVLNYIKKITFFALLYYVYKYFT